MAGQHVIVEPEPADPFEIGLTGYILAVSMKVIPCSSAVLICS